MEHYPVVFSNQSRLDLYAIEDWITKDNSSRAKKFINELLDASLSIGNNPLGIALAPYLEDLEIRRRVYKKYLIFYHVKNDKVVILRILHGAMDYTRFFTSSPSLQAL